MMGVVWYALPALIWAAVLCVGGSAWSGESLSRQSEQDVISARAKVFEPCLNAAASNYSLPPILLKAIVAVENGRWNPLAISINRQGKGFPQTVRSEQEAQALVTRLWLQNVNFDVGLGQINTINMERYRIHPVALLDPCVNLSYAARILREAIDRHGYSWLAIERYNGINPSYPWKVMESLDRFRREGGH
jgi:soluble lytic murein transglycosylase-like protein